MRILHVAYIYPPELDVADGITNVVFNVTKELARRGNQVSVYTSDMLDLHGNNSLRANHLIINGVDVYYSRSIWRSKTFIVTPSMISLLSKNIDNFDIIHIHDARSFQGISTYLFARAKNFPYVFQPHGSYLPSLPGSPSKTIAKITLDKLVSGGIIRNASKVIALNEVEAEQYKRLGVPEEKIAIIPNRIDLSEYANLPPEGSFKKKFNIPEKSRIILYLGRIHKTKGIDLLVKAYAYLVKSTKNDNIDLVIAGPDDGYLNELRSLTSSLGISDSVLFTGFISHEDKLKALVDAHVFVTPCFYGFPVTFLEACVTGTPIITTTLGDYLEWIDKNVGYVTLPNITAIAESINKLVCDDDLYERLSRNCRNIVKSEFSMEGVANRLEQVYEQAAAHICK